DAEGTEDEHRPRAESIDCASPERRRDDTHRRHRHAVQRGDREAGAQVAQHVEREEARRQRHGAVPGEQVPEEGARRRRTHHDDQHTPVAPLAWAHGVRVVLVAEQVDAHDTGEARDGGPRAEAGAPEATGAQRADEADGERARSEVQRPRDEDCAAGAGAEKLGDYTLGIGCAKRGPERRRIRGHRRQGDSSNVSTKPNWAPLRCSDVCSGWRGSRRETARGRDGTRGIGPRAKLAAAEPGGVRDDDVTRYSLSVRASRLLAYWCSKNSFRRWSRALRR